MTNQDFLDELWGASSEAPQKPSTFNSVKLALYFRERFFEVTWTSGFASTDVNALAGALAKWKKAGALADDVIAMIDKYMDDPSVRGKNPGWRDFLYHKEQISAALAKTEKTSVWSDRVEESDADAVLAEFLAKRRKK